jgi:diaminopimelate decarboxylase
MTEICQGGSGSHAGRVAHRATAHTERGAGTTAGVSNMDIPGHVAAAARAHSAANDGPFYLYDTSAIRSVCARFRSLPYPDTAVCFATMANAHPEFLRVIAEEGLGVFVNSLGHLELARRCGFAGSRVVFVASAMTDATMAAVRDASAMVNLDSPSQVARWRQVCPGVPFGIRCNIGGLVRARETLAGYFIGPDSRLGMWPDEITALAGAKDIRGLHIYVGTGIAEVEYFRECYRQLLSFVGIFPDLSYLDLGGGFALRDAAGAGFDYDAFGTMSAAVMTEASGIAGRPLSLVLEPGRILGGEAGYFVCRVVDIKQGPTRQLIGVNASCAQFPRPLFYPETARHPVQLLPSDKGPRSSVPVPSAVVGCSTYSRDYLARDVNLPAPKVGDIMVIGQAGSYCAAAHTSFLGFPPAREVFL